MIETGTPEHKLFGDDIDIRPKCAECGNDKTNFHYIDLISYCANCIYKIHLQIVKKQIESAEGGYFYILTKFEYKIEQFYGEYWDILRYEVDHIEI